MGSGDGAVVVGGAVALAAALWFINNIAVRAFGVNVINDRDPGIANSIVVSDRDPGIAMQAAVDGYNMGDSPIFTDDSPYKQGRMSWAPLHKPCTNCIGGGQGTPSNFRAGYAVSNYWPASDPRILRNLGLI